MLLHLNNPVFWSAEVLKGEMKKKEQLKATNNYHTLYTNK